jgi:adenosylmethionine-8-amino-7-oxononanoate aminotransferase
MTNQFCILGTDTSAGKTTFAALWLAAFPDEFEYWKPVETGDSDSELVRQLVPGVAVHSPDCRFRDSVAPPLAARREGRRVPPAADLVRAQPAPRDTRHGMLIETFGSPFSPLGDAELQVELIRGLGCPCVLVGSSRLGAIGRMLQCVAALAAHEIRPVALVLVGPADPFALEQIGRHTGIAHVFALAPPEQFSAAGFACAAANQRVTLLAIHDAIATSIARRSSDDWNAATRIVDRDRRTVWHPYSPLRAADAPLVVVRAQDEFLELADGRRVIDAVSSWWTILHGHLQPELMAALADAARRYDHVYFAGVTHEPAVELAELMLGTMPWSGGRVFFSDDGSTAVEVALKMAYQYWCHRVEPQRTLFVGFEGGYHGDTFGAMAVGRDPVFFGRFEPLLFRTERVPVSAAALDACLSRHAGRVAAVIIEPLVQGAGGMLMHSPAELRAIFDVARWHGVLFIADEVMTGGGRTGDLWAHQTAGIAPDLLCAGKTLAGGVLPLAATLAAPHVVAAFDADDRTKTLFHGHSFTAHPLACAVGVANWRKLSRGVGPAPARMEQFWFKHFVELRGREGVSDVRIRGTIAAIEVNVAGGYLSDVGRIMRRVALEHGVLLRPLGNVLYCMPPLCTSADSRDRIAQAMQYAIDAAVGQASA